MIAIEQKPKPTSGTIDNLVFVLWGEQFQEATAAIFTTKIRQSGLCVKVVGLAGVHTMGKNGLALYPDMTLGEALKAAEQAVCVVLPCSMSLLKQIEADPRLVDLFRVAYSNGAKFVISTFKSFEETRLGKICLASTESISTDSALAYGDASNLLLYAEEFGTQLSKQLGFSPTHR